MIIFGIPSQAFRDPMTFLTGSIYQELTINYIADLQHLDATERRMLGSLAVGSCFFFFGDEVKGEAFSIGRRVAIFS